MSLNNGQSSGLIMYHLAVSTPKYTSDLLNLLTYLLTYLLTHSLTHSLHKAESFLRSYPVLS